MKIQRTFFQELAKKKYLDYIRSLPQFKQEQTQAYLMVILVIFTVLFFGIFAIMPTLSTIAQLKKDLEDSTFLNDQLKTKITNMAQLQQEYTVLSPDLPYLLAAIPQDAEVTHLVGQLQTLGQQAGISIKQLQVQEIPETTTKKNNELQSFMVAIDAAGTYGNLQTFYTSLTRFERIMTIESMTLTKNIEDGTLLLNVKANAYFKQ